MKIFAYGIFYQKGIFVLKNFRPLKCPFLLLYTSQIIYLYRVLDKDCCPSTNDTPCTLAFFEFESEIALYWGFKRNESAVDSLYPHHYYAFISSDTSAKSKLLS